MSNRLAELRAKRRTGESNDTPAFEMSNVPSPEAANSSSGMPAFYNEISSIQDATKQFNANVTRISELHARSLETIDDTSNQRTSAELDRLVNDTRALSNDLKNRIKSLEGSFGSGREAQIRKDQTGRVKANYIDALQNYQRVEQQHRSRLGAKAERQFKAVKPDATPEEVAEVVNNTQGRGDQIFAQALSSAQGARYGEGRAAYKEVQDRHADIKKVERTFAELAQLINDMGDLVDQQDNTIDHIQEKASGVQDDTEAGLNHTIIAKKHASNARKARWICFWISFVILCIVGIVVGIEVSKIVRNRSH